MPGFPNYFTMFGPYGYNGSSYFNLVETQRGTSSALMNHARDRGATMVEVRPRRPTTGTSPRCSGAAHTRCSGRTAARWRTATTSIPTATCRCAPAPTFETIWRSRHFPLHDYRFESLVGAGSRAEAAAGV